MLPWIDNCIGSLADLTVEQAWTELISKIIPSASSTLAAANSNSDETHSETEGNPTIEADEEVEEIRNSKMQYQLIIDCLLQAHLDLSVAYAFNMTTGEEIHFC